jgi:hypothetical protein
MAQRTAYLIRNARLDPDWASVDRRPPSILGQSINTTSPVSATAPITNSPT